MAKLIDLGKLRFYFAGEWNSSTTYEVNDIVKYGGNIYVYTYGLKTSGNLPTDTTFWQLMVEGFKFEGPYDNTANYQIGDGVSHGGKVYIAIADTTGNTPPNASYWSQFADGIQWEGAYSSVTAYQKNDIVTYGGSAYIAKLDTTNNLPSDGTYWQKFVEGISAEGVYNSGTAYVEGDVVAYGGNLYRALGDTTGNDPENTTYWAVHLEGVSAQGDYNSGTTYNPNDVVYYGGSLYRATTTTTGNAPTDTNYWSVFQNGINPRSDWTTATSYYPGDVVSYGGNTYLCLVAHASNTFATDLSNGNWEKFNGGIRWQGDWTSGANYLVDDIVKEGVSTYIVTEDHTAGTFATDEAAGKLTEFAAGGDYVLDSSIGQSDKVLGTNGTSMNYSFVSPLHPAGVTAVTANTTMTSGILYAADTTGGAFTLTLPASPSQGDFVRILDTGGDFEVNNLTVARNGENIANDAADLTVDVGNASVTLVYITNYGWGVL